MSQSGQAAALTRKNRNKIKKTEKKKIFAEKCEMAWWAHVTKCGWEKTRSSSRQDLRSRNAVTCFNTSGQVKTQIQRYQQHIQFLYAVCETVWSLQLVCIWMRYLTYDTFFEKTALVYICAVVYSIHGLTGSHVNQLVLRCACRRNDTLLPVAMTRTRKRSRKIKFLLLHAFVRMSRLMAGCIFQINLPSLRIFVSDKIGLW